MRVHVMIATPSPGVVRAGYVRTLVATIADLTQNGVGSSYSISEGGDVAHQRNLLAARFLKSEATHLFWIDSDMSFEGGLCRRMLAARKPVVGAVYCTKEHNPDRRAWHEWSADAAVEVRGGLAPIDTLAFGVILVRRDVFTTMVDKGAAPLHSHRNGTFNNFFAPRRDDLDAGKFLSEDLAFCRRWRIDCGGEIWAYLDAKIGHIGDYAYGADQSYLDWLKEKGAFTPQGA